jgi:hypothetical protein
VLLRSWLYRALPFLFELDKIVVGIGFDVLLYLSFECFQALFYFLKFVHISSQIKIYFIKVDKEFHPEKYQKKREQKQDVKKKGPTHMMIDQVVKAN